MPKVRKFLIIYVDHNYGEDLRRTLEQEINERNEQVELDILAARDPSLLGTVGKEATVGATVGKEATLETNVGNGLGLTTKQVLAQYDAILLDACARDQVLESLGDQLERYSTETGGGVVMLAHTFHSSHPVRGKMASLLSPLAIDSNWWGDGQCLLGERLVPAHPLFHNVHRFDGGTFSGHKLDTLVPANRHQATILARWTDGSIFAAEYTNPLNLHAKILALNVTAVSSHCVSTCWKGDGGALFLNALISCARNNINLWQSKAWNMVQTSSNYCDVMFQFK